MKWFEKLTILFAQHAFPKKENAVIAALKGRLETQCEVLERELKAIRPDRDGRTWRITYHPIYKPSIHKPLTPRKLADQISLTTVIALHTKAENAALASLMRSGRPLTLSGYKRSDIMSRAFALNAHPRQQSINVPALMLVHEKLINGQISRQDGHGVHAFLSDIEAHVRATSHLVGWQGFPREAKRSLLLATGQKKRGRKHQI